MPRWLIAVLVALIALTAVACDESDDDDDDDPLHGAIGDDDDDAGGGDDDDDAEAAGPILPGPGMEGHDPDLAAKARRFDRQVAAINEYGMGLTVDLSAPPVETPEHELISAFIEEGDGFDFEAATGVSPFDVIPTWHKVAGLYAGSNLAADAFRYGVLRDEAYPAEEVDQAREILKRGIETFHIATAITGVPGVIARGLFKMDIPGHVTETTPLFDALGNPLPPEKDNGTWRDDNSGQYPDWQWEDSCSRDQYLGWMAAFGAIWEVIRDDDTFSEEVKDRLRADASAIGRELMVIRESGFDLEIPDADGRTTFHGYLNENNIDRVYLPWLPVKNGMYAGMALGCVAAMAYASGDPVLEGYLYGELMGERGLHEIAGRNQVGVYLGNKTNFSGVNMAFQGMWLAHRYIEDEDARELIRGAMRDLLYGTAENNYRMAIEQGQTLYDFMYATTVAGASAYTPIGEERDAAAIASGVQTLKEFPDAPLFSFERINCDEDEIESGICYAVDGTLLHVLGYVARNEGLITKEPIPMEIRPYSNYYWRSDPYKPNGGGVGGISQSVDFRWAYWLGRWVR